MGRPVTVQTRCRTCHQVRYLILRMSGGVQELLRLGVAAQTANVRVRLRDVDRKDVAAGRVPPHMAQAVELGLQRAGEAVVGMAGVAVMFLYVAVLEMRGGERVALDVLQ